MPGGLKGGVIWPPLLRPQSQQAVLKPPCSANGEVEGKIAPCAPGRPRSRVIIERSTTATDSVDRVETGWTVPHANHGDGNHHLAKVRVVGSNPSFAPSSQVEASFNPDGSWAASAPRRRMAFAKTAGLVLRSDRQSFRRPRVPSIDDHHVATDRRT